MIVVDRAGTRWTGTPAQWDELALQVRARTCVHLPGFLDAALLDQIRALVERTAFVPQRHGDLSLDERAEPGPLAALLLLVLNDPVLMRLVEKLTGCGALAGFEGRVYRMAAAAGHYDSWHSDSGGDRKVALSINLNRDLVATAPLQIRARDSDSMLFEFANATPGDAVLFTLDDFHVHRVKPTEGVPVRTACAGWFHSGAGMLARLREGRYSSRTRSKT